MDRNNRPAALGTGKASTQTPIRRVYRPFPGTDSGGRTGVPSTRNQVLSSHRVAMKDIEIERVEDGGLVLVSKHSSIKLDKFTTYVFAAAGLVPSK